MIIPQKISIIIPAYNEGAVIANTIHEIGRVFSAERFEIIVVDDGSMDDTFERAQQAAVGSASVQVLHYAPNHGKGYALKYGAARATGELVAFLDADADLHPSLLFNLWYVMEQRRADIVVGSKYHPESKLHYPIARQIVSQGYYLLVHLLFGLPIRDTQTGIKLFQRRVLEEVLPKSEIDGFAFDLELLVSAQRSGYSIAEAPVVLTYRPGGAHSLQVLPASINVARETFRVFYRTKISRLKD